MPSQFGATQAYEACAFGWPTGGLFYARALEFATAAGIEEPPVKGGRRSNLYQRRLTVSSKRRAANLIRALEAAYQFSKGGRATGEHVNFLFKVIHLWKPSRLRPNIRSWNQIETPPRFSKSWL